MTFPPGLYLMRNGERAEVFAERDGRLFGCRDHTAVDWNLDGSFFRDRHESGSDLISPWIEPVKPFECWVNRYGYAADDHFVHTTEEAADNAAVPGRIGPAIYMREVLPENKP